MAKPVPSTELSFQTCQRCEVTDETVQRRRQNTAYVKDESNYAVLCNHCQAEADEYWSDMWAEYYSGCL